LHFIKSGELAPVGPIPLDGHRRLLYLESFLFPICGARVSVGVGVGGVVEGVTAATRAAFPTRRRASPVASPRGTTCSSPTSGAGRLPLTRRPFSPRPSRAGAEMH